MAASFMGSGGGQKDDVSASPTSPDQASYDYDTHVWNNRGATKYQAPLGTWEQAAAREASMVMTMPRPQIRKMVKSPMAAPPKGVRHRPAPDIFDVFDEVDTYGDRRTFFSGSPAGYTGSTRNADGVF